MFPIFKEYDNTHLKNVSLRNQNARVYEFLEK